MTSDQDVPAAPLGRYLILDTGEDSARWLIATITIPSDTRVAVMERDGRRYKDWDAITAFVRDQVGGPVRLVPVSAIVWRVDERTPREEGDRLA